MLSGLEIDHVMAMVTAVLFGGAIGLERALSGKPAGLRTNILICLGSAIFTSIGISLSGGSPEAVSRLASGIMTGIGFLGAGVLIHEGSGVHGLTTAASVWLVATIGIACGAGLYATAGVATLFGLLVLVTLSPVAKKIKNNLRKKQTGYGAHKEEGI